MAVTLKKLHCTRMPTVSIVGSDQRTHTAQWVAEVSEQTASDFVLALAWGLFPTEAPGISPFVPQQGDAVATDDGEVIPGVLPSTVAAWVTAGAGRYADGGAVAKNFECRQSEDGGLAYVITVTFRAPEGGMRFDQLKWAARFASLSTTLPTITTTPTTPAAMITALNNGNAPLAEPKNIRCDYVVRHGFESSAFKVTRNGEGDPVAVGQRVPVVNPNGEPYPPYEVVRKNRIVSVSMPVGNGPLFVWLMETLYGNSLNASAFTFEGETIPKWHARFEGCECSDEIVTDAVTYNVITWRIELATPGSTIASGFVRQELETGTYYRNASGQIVVPEDTNGTPITDRIPLAADGDWAVTNAPGTPQFADQGKSEWIHHRLVDYTDILSGA